MDPDEAKAFLEQSSLQGVPAGVSPLQQPLVTPPGQPPGFTGPPTSTLGIPGLEVPKDPFGVQAKYRRETEEPGVPLDVSTGSSPWERFWVGSMRDPETALTYMQKKYGPKNVRLDKGGDFVFRIPDKDTGKPKDIKFKPMDMSFGDVAELASAIPEVAGGILGIMSARKVPALGKLGGFTRDVVAGALGGEAAGAVKDIGLNVAEQGTPQIAETLKQRGVASAEDVGIGAATYGAGRFFKFMGAPFTGQRGPVQFKLQEARDYFKNNPRYGIDVPISASEATGSPILGRSEVYTEIQPGGFGPLKKLKGQQEKALLDLQNVMTGATPTPSDEEIVRRVEHAVGPALATQEKGVEAATKALTAAGETELGNIATARTMPARQLYRDVVGREVRSAVQAKQAAAMAEADRLYAEADRFGAKNKIIDGTPLQAKLRTILKSLPSAEVDKPSPILGPTGRPLMTRTTETLEKWPPEKLLGRIREILAMKNPEFSISDLKQMRRDIYDDITRGQGVPDLGAHYLSQIGGAITDTMKDAVNKMPTSDLKRALLAADKHWKDNVVPFDRPGITELFRKEGETGFISDDDVVSRIFSTAKSPSVSLQNYNLMRETLGASSPQFQKVKRTLIDHILESNRKGGEFIDPGTLVQSLHDLRTNYRAVADDVFGPKLNDMFKQARYLQYAKDSKIPADELDALMRDPNPTAAKLKDLVLKQQRLDDTYRNGLLKDVSKNMLNPGSVNPSEFVSRFLENPKTSTSEIKQVMGMLAHTPSLLEDIQSKAIENILNSSTRRLTANDIAHAFVAQSSRVPSAAGLVKSVSDMGGPEKLKALIGPEKFNDLEQFFNLVRGTEYKYASSGYTMAGAFAATSTVKALEHLDLWRFAKPTMANWFVAKMLTNPVFRQWAGHVPANPDPGFISLFLSSPAFLKEVAKDYPGSSGLMFVSALKEGMDQWLGQRQQNRAPISQGLLPDEDQRRQDLRRFLEMSAPSPNR